MKRDWDIIRQQLTNIENDHNFLDDLPKCPVQADQTKEEYNNQMKAYDQNVNQAFGHLKLLIDSGYVDGVKVQQLSFKDWGYGGASPRLTMAGHDLLDTMRSNPVWEKIKETATKKGIELTFDSVKLIGSTVLKSIIGS